MNNPEIKNQLMSLSRLFEDHQVDEVFLFGSALRSDFNSSSDIDLIVNFKQDLDPLKKGELWWSLHDRLRSILNREVDFVSEHSVKNPFFKKELDTTRVRIYG
jgi:predicted nucleotidyltransferase